MQKNVLDFWLFFEILNYEKDHVLMSWLYWLRDVASLTINVLCYVMWVRLVLPSICPFRSLQQPQLLLQP